MKKTTNLKKIAMFGVITATVGAAVIPFATSCSAASTVPDFISNTNFYVVNDSNSFRIKNGAINFNGNGGLGNPKCKTSPGYKIPKDDGSDKAAVDANNDTINQFSVLQTAATWAFGFVLTSSDLLANCYNSKVIDEIPGVDPQTRKIAQSLATYQGEGSEVQRYRVKTLTFTTDPASTFTSGKKYGDAATNKPEDNVITYTTDIDLAFSYWHTTNGENMVWDGDNATLQHLKIKGLSIKMIPNETKKGDTKVWSGLYSIQSIDNVSQITLGSLDAKRTSFISSTFLTDARNNTQGSIVDSNIKKYYNSHKTDFADWIKTFSA